MSGNNTQDYVIIFQIKTFQPQSQMMDLQNCQYLLNRQHL